MVNETEEALLPDQ
ncbi:hypothetical protein SS209_03081 [Salmonella enterica subsp. enterica serovar Senftenberg str. SS209]|nr:hypothetical protein SS209_03081 [Salmonella enterica subsp. enterica serovar Senftenberg str. SS209]